MRSTTEDRLVAALGARAELVTPQDLSPIEVPSLSRRRPRRGAVLLLAAAATAAAVAAPFVLRGGDGDAPGPGPAGPSTAGVTGPTSTEHTAPRTTQSAPTTSGPTPLRNVKLVDRQQADLDGDGQPDDVRLMLGTAPDSQVGGYLEVSLAAGGAASTELPVGYLSDHLLPAYDIGHDGHEQVMLTLSGGDSESLLVYTWYDGRLVEARSEGRAPLALGLDGEGEVSDYYVDDRGLFSWLRQQAVAGAGGHTFHVKQWSWTVEGDHLVPTLAVSACVDVTTQEPPQACPGS